MLDEEFNQEPVHYCKHCLSLNIKIIDLDDNSLDYCSDCGCTEIETTDIFSWKEKYKQKYNKEF